MSKVGQHHSESVVEARRMRRLQHHMRIRVREIVIAKGTMMTSSKGAKPVM